MKDQILKLCRRLKQCTLEDIIQFTEKTEEEIMPVIYYLLDNDFLIENNGVYSLSTNKNTYSKKVKNLYLMQQYHSEEELEIIIKGFCLKISPNVLTHFVKCDDSCICDFHQIFRKKIYELQHNQLLVNYFKRPQAYRYRMFFEKYAYFYYYNNQVFVSEKPLRANKECSFTKTEIQEFKKTYSFLNRMESHNMNVYYLYHRLAENIWRKNKDFEQMYLELKKILNIS